jgi:hypothetical protein
MKQGQAALQDMMMKEGQKKIDDAFKSAITETDEQAAKAHFSNIEHDHKELIKNAVMQAIQDGRKHSQQS